MQDHVIASMHDYDTIEKLLAVGFGTLGHDIVWIN